MKYQNHNKNLKSLENIWQKSCLPAKLSLFFCLFSGASGIGSPDSRPSTRTYGDLFHWETDGKKEKKQKLIVISINILIFQVFWCASYI